MLFVRITKDFFRYKLKIVKCRKVKAEKLWTIDKKKRRFYNKVNKSWGAYCPC